MADARDFATDLFQGLCALNRQLADLAQREYESLTPEARRALWADRRTELARIKAECAEKGIAL